MAHPGASAVVAETRPAAAEENVLQSITVECVIAHILRVMTALCC